MSEASETPVQQKKPLVFSVFCLPGHFRSGEQIACNTQIANKGEQITHAMLGRLRQSDRSEVQIRKLEKYWNVYKSKSGSNKLCKAVLRAYVWNFLIATVVIAANCLIEMLTPFFLYRLMQFLQDPQDTDYTRGIIMMSCMLLAQYISFIITKHGQYYCEIQGYKSEIALIGLITKKSLRTSPSASKTFSQGEIVNRLSTDSSNLREFCERVAQVLTIILTIIIGVVGIFKLLGLTILWGGIPLLFIIIVNIYLVKLSSELEQKFMWAQDKRMEVTTQTMQSIKTLKLTGWVNHFKKKISKARGVQLQLLKKGNLIQIFQQAVLYLLPVLITGTIFGVHLAQGHELTPSIVYTMLLIFELIKGPLNELPYIIGSFVETYTSMKRIEDYLLVDQVQEKLVLNNSEDPFDYALKIQNASFAWRTKPEEEQDEDE